jgi:DNA processing protein
MELDAALPWLALGLTRGLGPRLTGKLLGRFGTPEAIFRASLTELESCDLPAATARAVSFHEGFSPAAKELASIRELGVQLINWNDTEYPPRLLEIYDPPPLLYLRGDPQVLRRHCISIVGTRRPTLYGNLMAERLARDLAERGLLIVSGLARGIDSSAHKGACASIRGSTVGVLGTGIDVLYPKENKKLFAEVEKRGAIITEFQLGAHAAPENFPVRNRIVAGMSLGTVIVEGAQYSGSLITGRLAMEFGREVYGVPGNVTQPSSFAPNQLIKQGAKLVTDWQDVVEELPTEIRTELFPVDETTIEERATLFSAELAPEQKKLYDLLSVEQPMHVDEIVQKSGMSSSVGLATLCEMELRGIIRQLPGKQFVRAVL